MGNKLGETIKSYRKAAKLTQKQLAERLTKAESTVRMWELGKNMPPLDTLKNIGIILNIPLGTLLLSAGYIDEFKEMLDENVKKPMPIPTLGEAIDIARSDWSNDDNPDEFYEISLETISKKANIPLEKLIQIQKGENISLTNEELANLADVLDATFAYFYLIANRNNTFFEREITDDLIRRLHFISANETNKAKDLSFEEFCKITNETQLKYNPHYEPGENELMEWYKEYQFARSVNSLVRSFAFSEIWSKASEIRYLIEDSSVNLNYKGRKLSKQDREKILTKITEIEHEFQYED